MAVLECPEGIYTEVSGNKNFYENGQVCTVIFENGEGEISVYENS